jgi:hypothetical protein
MSTKFLEVMCDEYRVGGDGEYCGDADAHLDRINVFLASHTRCGALSLLQKPVYYRGIQQISLLDST